jgi:hypothetical protein
MGPCIGPAPKKKKCQTVLPQSLKPRGNAAMGQLGGVALPFHALLRCQRTLVRAGRGRLRSDASPVA